MRGRSATSLRGARDSSKSYDYDQHRSLPGRSATSLRDARDSSKSYDYNQHPSFRGRSATSLRGSRDSSKSYDSDYDQHPSFRGRSATSSLPGSRDSSKSYDNDYDQHRSLPGRSAASLRGSRDSSKSCNYNYDQHPSLRGRSATSRHGSRDSSKLYDYDQHPSVRGRSFTTLRGSRDSSKSNDYNCDQYPSLRDHSTTSMRGSRDSSKSYDYNFVQPPSIRRRAATSTIPGSHDSSESHDYIDIQLPRLRSRTSSVCGPCEPESQSSVDDSDSDDDYVLPAEDSKHELVSSSGGVQVALSSNTEHKRKWDKKQYCVYCSKCFGKLPRHFQQKHANEIEVAEAISLPLKSVRRRLIWEKLRREGNYNHNSLVLETKRGEIVPLRRPSQSCSAERFLPCEFCKAFLVKRDLVKHEKNCNMKKIANEDPDLPRGNRRCQSRGALLLPLSAKASDGLKRDILSYMNTDKVSSIIRADDLIIEFGNRLHFKNGHHRHRWQGIRERMRELGRLLSEVKEEDPEIECLTDCMTPSNFKIVIKSIHNICGFDQNSHIYKTPSLALKIGHSLKQCANILIGMAMEGDQSTQIKSDAEDFVRLCEMNWKHSVSSHALRTLYTKKFNKPSMLPLADDLKKFQNYLLRRAEECIEQLDRAVDSRTWIDLSRVTLTQVILFNRRRGGEAERIPLSTFVDRQQLNVNDEILYCLTKVEKALLSVLDRVEIEGKRGRKVPVLFTKRLCNQIDCLVKTRSAAGVLDSNQYLFAQIKSLNPQKSSVCLRRFAIESGAKHPQSLTSTKLRKHIATMSQVLSLRDNELDLLASFMGHDIRIHREFYRLPEETLQVARVSKLLMAMEKNDISEFAGKTLEEINVEIESKFSEFDRGVARGEPPRAPGWRGANEANN